jgi:hypothetical protein
VVDRQMAAIAGAFRTIGPHCGLWLRRGFTLLAGLPVASGLCVVCSQGQRLVQRCGRLRTGLGHWHRWVRWVADRAVRCTLGALPSHVV